MTNHSYFKRFRALTLGVVILCFVITMSSLGSSRAYGLEEPISERHFIETFPIMAFFDVYSVQYAYRVHPRLSFITGFAYVNVEVQDRTDTVIGRMHAPTIPIGLRWYFWKNAHLEYQLWPAYNAYHDYVEDRYYSGLDIYNEIRAGYRFDFDLGPLPLFSSVQYVYGFGLWPGTKPKNFLQAVDEAPPFHVPSLSIGVRL